jgi:3-hydroxyisobutyrate dehydrogenase-like beta-hydroxyacid dehydrogenase
MRADFIGLGSMGSGIAINLVKTEHEFRQRSRHGPC